MKLDPLHWEILSTIDLESLKKKQLITIQF